MFTRAEAAAAAALSLLASVVVAAYLADAIGLTISPVAILSASLLASAAIGATIWRRAVPDPSGVAALLITVVVMFGWLLWLAGPDRLPPGTGPDLTHHLLLVDYIDRHWRLPRDPQLGAYLGEMLDYTPGSHLLASLSGSLTRSDGLHAMYPVTALSVALKTGFVLLIARRLIGRASLTDTACAATSVLFLLLPRAYVIGSFVEHSFLAQVVSECFAVGMWWTTIVWDERPTVLAMALFALFGAATFLTWPVWIGPFLIVLVVCAFARTAPNVAERARDLAIAVIPVVGVAMLHTVHNRSTGIVAATGFVLRPAPAVFGWTFLLASGCGVCVASLRRHARTIPLLLGAIALQAAGLHAVAHARGAPAPYLALKMTYLVIYPLAVAGSLGVAAAWKAMMPPRAAARALPRRLSARALLALVVAAVLGTLVRTPRPRPVITESMLLAGRWARAHAPPNCVDYITSDSYGAYWLHLAVMGNPRDGRRSNDDRTYAPQEALTRWIEPGGLPYAIVEDFEALPRDIRVGVDVVARFGRAAVLRRRGSAACAPAS